MQVLKVREIMVMGHGMCGGCKAALTQELHGTIPGEGGFIADWIAMLDHVREPIVREFGTTGRPAERAMEQAGVKVSLANLQDLPLRQFEGSRGRAGAARRLLRHIRWGACTCWTRKAATFLTGCLGGIDGRHPCSRTSRC